MSYGVASVGRGRAAAEDRAVGRLRAAPCLAEGGINLGGVDVLGTGIHLRAGEGGEGRGREEEGGVEHVDGCERVMVRYYSVCRVSQCTLSMTE
jgi:hypothetical protein